MTVAAPRVDADTLERVRRRADPWFQHAFGQQPAATRAALGDLIRERGFRVVVAPSRTADGLPVIWITYLAPTDEVDDPEVHAWAPMLSVDARNVGLQLNTDGALTYWPDPIYDDDLAEPRDLGPIEGAP
jgi:DNA-binding IclR family transcriptional regulator